MHTVIAIFSVLFGLVFGSFLNVCISRLPRGESVFAPRSRCPRCSTPIRASDNIPLLSWALLRGRCRSCRAPISLRYPLVEILTAALYLLCFLHFGLSLRGIGAGVLCFLLIGLAVMDAETMLLPNAFTVPGIAFGVLYFTAEMPTAYADYPRIAHPHLAAAAVSIVTAASGAGLVLLIRWLYSMVRHREGMGLGDAKLLAMIGAWFGPAETFLVFFLAVITGAGYGLAIIGIARSRSRPEAFSPPPAKVPLGAFLCLAALYTLFYGQQTLAWYLHLIVA